MHIPAEWPCDDAFTKSIIRAVTSPDNYGQVSEHSWNIYPCYIMDFEKEQIYVEWKY